MPLDKWIVLIAGVAAIAWLNWHFFRSVRRRDDTKREPSE
jgi:hypothetical protein